MAQMSTDGDIIPPCTAYCEEDQRNTLQVQGIAAFRTLWVDLWEKLFRLLWPQNRNRKEGDDRSH